MRKFYLETFGCQMNVHDSEKVAGILLARGYTQVAEARQADLILYNTCSVRGKAEQKVYSRLQQFQREAGRGKTFAVLGCVAQQEGERLFERAPHVALVCGPASYNRLPGMLAELEAGRRRLTGLDTGAEETFETPLTHRGDRHRAYITITEGCDKSCAYCVVPSTRGRERSRPSTAVLEEVRELAGRGYSEVQLLGQNVNSYRDPSPAGWDFATLLDRVAGIPGLRRVRFMTSHPRDFTREIVEAIDSNPVLANHVHLPVQSGSTRVLERMQRLYTREEYLVRIQWLKQARRGIAISSDIIVGFPGETEEDFRETLSLLDEVRYDSAFSFKYSPRPNTAALALEGEVPEDEKRRRLALVQEKQRAIQLLRNSERIGAVEKALVEKFNPATGQWIGRTSQNRVLNFTHPQNGQCLAGEYLSVRVTGAGPNSLTGVAVA
jgi:tRNA-2-methylthio-N6-dimethylallyladenosine synthase